METRRFDELTVALARGGSRRGVLRGLVGGVLGALALDRSGALAKNDNANGGGRPITSPAAPTCNGTTAADDCPLCHEAKYGTDGCCTGEGEQFCGLKATTESCAAANANNCGASSTFNGPGVGSCVEAYCDTANPTRQGPRCAYTKKDNVCTKTNATFCCARFGSSEFGHCVKGRREC
jgi:hypothetical protein